MKIPMEDPFAQQAVDFLTKIGLNVEIVQGATGFLPTIEIRDGSLRVDPGACASNILHEAGHLAIVPGRFRGYLSGNLNQGMVRIQDVLVEENLDPDSYEMRAMMQAGDTEATAWAWAAGKAIGLPEHEIIRSEEYGGEGEGIRFMLSLCAYVGIHGISHAGFCLPRENPYCDRPAYPKMAFWLQP